MAVFKFKRETLVCTGRVIRVMPRPMKAAGSEKIARTEPDEETWKVLVMSI